MDLLKKKRAAQRAIVTKASNALSALIDQENREMSELTSVFLMYEQKVDILNVTQNAIYELMYADDDVTETQIEEETESADAYARTFFRLKHKVDDLKAPSNSEVSAAARSGVNFIAASQNEASKTFKLPKIELIPFSGEPREWLAFWSLFKKIDEDSSIVREDKFRLLIQSMVKDSRAYKLVENYPPTADNYDKVITSLKERFGRDDLQIEVYVRELLQLVLQNAIKRSQNMPGEPLCSLYDKLESYLRALETFGVTTEKCAAMLLPLVESSLPEELLRAWQRSPVGATPVEEVAPGSQAKNRLTRLIKFLGGEVQNEERISMAVKGFDLDLGEKTNVDTKRKRQNSVNKNVPSAMGLLAADDKTHSCVFCDSKDHKSANCPKAKNMSNSEKQECAQHRRACFKCLYIGHRGRDCHVNVKCETCSRKHVTIMCRDEKGGSATPQTTANNSSSQTEYSLANLSGCTPVFMQVLSVRLRGENGEKLVRALIDSGSQRSYLSKAAVAEMGYEPTGEQRMRHLLFGGDSIDSVIHKKYRVRLGNVDSDFACNFEVLDQDMICGKISKIPKGDWYGELKRMNIKLTDYCDSDAPIELLIGADVAGKLSTGLRVQLKCGLVAFETLLGWTVMGAVKDNKKEDAVFPAVSLHVTNCEVEDLWTIDTLDTKGPFDHNLEKQQQQNMCTGFLKDARINEDCCYDKPLSRLEEHSIVGDNKTIFKRRLPHRERKLKADDFYEIYGAVCEKQREEGIIEHVPKDAARVTGHFFPHQHVVEENSAAEMGPSYASAKQRPHPAFNDCLKKGPNFIGVVGDLLLQFRAGSSEVAAGSSEVSAYYENAFLRNCVDLKDKDFLYFLLCFDEYENSIVFRYNRVVFDILYNDSLIFSTEMVSYLDIIHVKLKGYSLVNFIERNIVRLLDSLHVDNYMIAVNSYNGLCSFMTNKDMCFKFRSYRNFELNHILFGKMLRQKVSRNLMLLYERRVITGNGRAVKPPEIFVLIFNVSDYLYFI